MKKEFDFIHTLDNQRNPFALLLGFFTLFLAIYLDSYMFKDDRYNVAYIPFMIMTGYLSRFVISTIVTSGIASLLIHFTSVEEEIGEQFIVRWVGFFLIAFVVRSLVLNILKEHKNIVVIITTLSKAIDARDHYTSFHSQNVAYYSREIGKAINLSVKECNHLYIGGLLHDFGKIGIPEAILNKPAKLTEEEKVIIKQHPRKGYDLLKDVYYFRKNSILDIILHHHERYDGTGYPSGLKGDEIPLLARIIAVADAFDAMTSSRIYRTKNDLQYAINQILSGKHHEFDPEIADVFLGLIENQKVVVRGLQN